MSGEKMQEVARFSSHIALNFVRQVFVNPSIASLEPETVQLPAFYILSAMFTGACNPPEKLSLALVQPSNVLRMILKLAYNQNANEVNLTGYFVNPHQTVSSFSFL